MNFTSSLVNGMRFIGNILVGIVSSIGSDFEAVIYFCIAVGSLITMIGFSIKFHNKGD